MLPQALATAADLQAALQQQAQEWASTQAAWQSSATQQQQAWQQQVQDLQEQQHATQSELAAALARAAADDVELATAAEASAAAEQQRLHTQLSAAHVELVTVQAELQYKSESMARYGSCSSGQPAPSPPHMTALAALLLQCCKGSRFPVMCVAPQARAAVAGNAL